jgi:hypothetical protein
MVIIISFSTIVRVVKWDGAPDENWSNCSQQCFTSHPECSISSTYYHRLLELESSSHLTWSMPNQIQEWYDPSKRFGVNANILCTALVCSFARDNEKEEPLLAYWNCAVVILDHHNPFWFLFEWPPKVSLDDAWVRQSLVSLLELAELRTCSNMVILLERNRNDLTHLVRALMCVGFRVFHPDTFELPRNRLALNYAL